MIKKYTCINCKNEFCSKKADKNRIPKFCSLRCCGLFKTGKKATKRQLESLKLGRISRPSHRKGKKLTPEHCFNISIGKTGKLFNSEHKNNLSKARIGKFCFEKSFSWKGDNVKYGGLHNWVYKKLGSPMICEFCGKEKTSNRNIHWANKSGEYKRIESDWIRLCVSCHKKYDKLKND